MNTLRIVGLDCALSNLGMAKVDVDVETLKITPIAIELVHTDSEKSKTVRVASDDLRRCRELREAMVRFGADADFYMGEVPTGGQSARACRAFGIVCGLYAGLPKEFIQVQPDEVKKAVTGRKTASKDEIMVWADRLYPTMPWKRLKHDIKKNGVVTKLKGMLTDDNEHMADAFGIIHAGIATEQFKHVVAFSKTRRAA